MSGYTDRLSPLQDHVNELGMNIFGFLSDLTWGGTFKKGHGDAFLHFFLFFNREWALINANG